MANEVEIVELARNGFIDFFGQKPIKEPIIAYDTHVYLDKLKEYKVPENLVKVTRLVLLNLKNRQGMNEDILNFLLELEKRCDEGVELQFVLTTALTQSDWDYLIENVVNNPSLKFGKYLIFVDSETDMTFNFDTDRELSIYKDFRGNLTLKGKMGEIEYYGNTDKLKVVGEFKDIINLYGDSIVREVYDYESLPDLYEDLGG